MQGQTGRKHRGTRDRVESTGGYEAVYRKAPKTQTGRNKVDTLRQTGRKHQGPKQMHSQTEQVESTGWRGRGRGGALDLSLIHI